MDKFIHLFIYFLMQVIVHSLINAPEHNNATAMLENFDASTGGCVCVVVVWLCVCVCVCVCVCLQRCPSG